MAVFGTTPVRRQLSAQRADQARDMERRSFVKRAASLALAVIGGGALDAAASENGAPAADLMATGEPSRTARSAALHRAAHQIVDHPCVFEDPYALKILEPLAAAELQATVDRRGSGMRASIALRSRYAEDSLAEAVARGTRQYVVLGAGLDTFACRNPHVEFGLQVYEVDHPASQRYKIARMRASDMAPRSGTHFVAIDFETQTLRAALTGAGFRFDQPAFFSMLGVAIYISDVAVMSTLRTIAACARGSEIAMSFAVTDELLRPDAHARRQRSMRALAAAVEPWITFYDPDVLTARLLEDGFSSARPLRPDDANRRYFADRRDGLFVTDAHMMLARV